MDKYSNLTAKGKDSYFKALEDIDWFNFSNVSKETISKRLEKIKENERFVFCLYDLSFDAEGFEDNNSYKSLLEEIIKITGLKNYKVDVKYIGEINSIKIKIKTKNNEYEYCINLNETEDWIDSDVIDEYINNLLVGEGMDRIFLPIPPEDQTVQFIYIKEDIYERAIEAGIIPEEQGYFIR
jgi:hypothetical protein